VASKTILSEPPRTGDREELASRLRGYGGQLAFLVPAADAAGAVKATWEVVNRGQGDTVVRLGAGSAETESLWLFFFAGASNRYPAWELTGVAVEERTVTVGYRARQVVEDGLGGTFGAGSPTGRYCWVPLPTRDAGEYRIRVQEAETQIEQLTRTITVMGR